MRCCFNNNPKCQESCLHYGACCGFSLGDGAEVVDDKPPAYMAHEPFNQLGSVYRPEVMETIEKTLEGLSPELRKLSLQIHGTVQSFPVYEKFKP
jgi:hypothetical protein